MEKKTSRNIMGIWQAYSDKRRRTLSWLGFGPVADWLIAVLIAFLSICGALYYGWSSYDIESHKEFVPQVQSSQSQGLRKQVESAINFFNQRNASVARVNATGAATTTLVVPPVPVSRSNSSGTSVPGIR